MSYRRQPCVHAYSSINLSIPNGVLTTILFNSESFDSGGMHSTVTNTGRLLAPFSGIYLFMASVTFSPNAVNSRFIIGLKNGATAVAVDAVPGTALTNPALGFARNLALNAGDYVEVQAFQDSGGALSIVADGDFNISADLFWMRPLP